MPEELKAELKKTAEKRGYSKDRADAYVYGTLTNIEKREKMKSALTNRKPKK